MRDDFCSMPNPQTIWEAVLGELELMLSKANFTTWFKNTFVIEVDEEKGHVVIGVPNAFTKSWMEQKYNVHIVEALNNVCKGKITEVRYEIQAVKKVKQKAVDSVSQVSLPSSEYGYQMQTARTTIHDFNLNKGNTFANFIVGPSNQLAHSASIVVAEKPGARYNPLFLYGDVGLGKTHLIHAIGNAVQSNHQELKILYVNFEKFTNDYVAAVRKGGFDEFRKTYRGADVLLVDDVQFMIDKEKTQDEFFHTFEVLHQNNKQIVITSDRPPKALVELQDRMISRFEWGMIADIKMPDFETRIAILENKCKERNFVLNPELVHYIAEHIKNNIRELEGALNKIIAMYELLRKEPTLQSVREILTSITIDPSKKALSPKRIIETVSEFYEVNVDQIIGSCRKREIVIPRQIIMYLMRQELEYSFPTIGQNLGGRDHTTVMYACQKIGGMAEQEDRLQQELETIRQRLYG